MGITSVYGHPVFDTEVSIHRTWHWCQSICIQWLALRSAKRHPMLEFSQWVCSIWNWGWHRGRSMSIQCWRYLALRSVYGHSVFGTEVSLWVYSVWHWGQSMGIQCLALRSVYGYTVFGTEVSQWAFSVWHWGQSIVGQLVFRVWHWGQLMGIPFWTQPLRSSRLMLVNPSRTMMHIIWIR